MLTVGYGEYVWGGYTRSPSITSSSLAPSPNPSRLPAKGLGVGVCEDVVQLRQDVRGISLERLLRNRPVCHRKQQCILLENGERGEGGEEQPIDIER